MEAILCEVYRAMLLGLTSWLPTRSKQSLQKSVCHCHRLAKMEISGTNVHQSSGKHSNYKHLSGNKESWIGQRNSRTLLQLQQKLSQSSEKSGAWLVLRLVPIWSTETRIPIPPSTSHYTLECPPEMPMGHVPWPFITQWPLGHNSRIFELFNFFYSERNSAKRTWPTRLSTVGKWVP